MSSHKIIDLTQTLNNLRNIPQEALRQEIRTNNIKIPEDKFTLAASAYGFTKWLSAAPVTLLKECAPPIIPSSDIDGLRWRSILVFRAYAAFVLMRSEYLERGLDVLPDTSIIRPFRDFFRSGSKKNGDDTIAQHIRNALCHGNIELTQDLQTVKFIDRDWEASISAKDFAAGLCEEIVRFYMAAYEVDKNIG